MSRSPVTGTNTRPIQVNLGDRSYAIYVGTKLDMAALLPFLNGKRAMLVSDTHVDSLHGERCAAALAAGGATVSRTVVPAGEESKNLEQAGRLYSAAMAAGLDRGSTIVALGGGMVGDLAGFVAATFLRGIRLIQMPTSLLAMVDSSVGGKTAINLPEGKNLVGAFYQPGVVVADLDWLDSLPEREYLSGLAEVVKYGIICDASLLDTMEAGVSAILRRDKALMAEIVARCCEIKAAIVEKDERESGLRAVLNFGHTLAHALENIDGYGCWLHGEAVSIGMVYALEISVRTGALPRKDADRIVRLLGALRLPVRRRADMPPIEWSRIRQAMAGDKKTINQRLRWVLTGPLGKSTPGVEVSETLLTEAWHVSGQ